MSDVADLLRRIHVYFEDENPEYVYGVGQNSNSYVNTLLWMVGLDNPSLISDAIPSAATGGATGSDLNILTHGEAYSITNPGYFEHLPVDIIFEATNGDNVMRTGTGNDQLNGGAGDDQLSTGAGHDLLVGGIGSDILDGGDGNDTVSYSSENEATDGGTGVGRESGIVIQANGDDVILVDDGLTELVPVSQTQRKSFSAQSY